jgi:hypothetical protein
MVIEYTLDESFTDMPSIQSGLLIGTVHTHCQAVFSGLEHVCYVIGKGLKIAGVVPEEFAIQVYIGKIIHTVEMQTSESFHWFINEFTAIPDNAVMVKAAQEPVLRDVHGSPGGVIEGRPGKVRLIFGGIAPITGKGERHRKYPH